MVATCQTAIDEALARAVVYHALSEAFQRPSEARFRRIGAGDQFATLASALRQLDEGTGAGPLTAAASRLTALALPGAAALTADFVRLFGHTAQGLVCVCETEYGPETAFHQPQQLADIAGYYLAFGLRPVAASDARADHVASECEFMDFLARKEALLLATGPDDDETLETTRQAARTFLRDHLGRFGRALATRLTVEDAGGFFGIFGEILLGLLELECRRRNIEAGPVDLVVRAADADDTVMACGTTQELIQIQRRP